MGKLSREIEEGFLELWPQDKHLLSRLQVMLGKRQEHEEQDWTKRAVYALYVDLFANDFEGLIHKLDYLQDLGVGAVWLLPILKSPMRDYGFDVADYFQIRTDLLNGRPQTLFYEFLEEARSRNIAIIFDIPLNHCSSEHSRFRQFLKNPSGEAREWFVVSEDASEYAECRILFKGMMESNWERIPSGEGYFFHRFYDFQPDWNWRNPQVFLHALEALIFWRSKGVSGFRLDAIPFLWKEEGTDCENLEPTHRIVKLIRACMDVVAPHTLLLAEACQPPQEVLKYFGDGDEVTAAYHFPLMPHLWEAMGKEKAQPVEEVLQKTPAIPDGCNWFVFLRCHDELTLEMVTPEVRRFLHETFCHDPAWDFREGEGISARMMELLKEDPRRMLLAFSLLLSCGGVPVLYYGDELGLKNDQKFFEKAALETGHPDSRHYVRGPVPWVEVSEKLRDPQTKMATIHRGVRQMLWERKKGLGEDTRTLSGNPAILSFAKTLGGKTVYCVHNLSSKAQEQDLPEPVTARLLSDGVRVEGRRLSLPAYAYAWVVNG